MGAVGAAGEAADQVPYQMAYCGLREDAEVIPPLQGTDKTGLTLGLAEQGLGIFFPKGSERPE